MSGETEIIGDVIVTATRREQRVADVPLSVTAIDQTALERTGATDIRQLMQLVPSLGVTTTGTEANATARLRGIGTVGDNPGLESSVAIFVDGVYRPRTAAGLNDIGELDRVEVLRGPQGTLAGRNATAGVINLYTRAPSGDWGGYGEATIGNYDARRFAASATGPVVRDLLSFRLDGVVQERDGFLRDIVNDGDYNDRHRRFVRGQLSFTPADTLTVRLIGDFTYRNEKCCAAVYVDTREKLDPTPGVAGNVAINPAGNRIVQLAQGLGAVFPGDPFARRVVQTRGRDYPSVTRDYGVSGQVDWQLGAATLTSITAYREYRGNVVSDVDYGNLDLVYRGDDGRSYRQFHTFTQELRLRGEALGGRLDWLVGGFYLHEDTRLVDNQRFGADYGAFTSCRIVAGIAAAAALRDPAAAGCLTPAGRGAVTAAFGANGAAILAGLDRLSTLHDRGNTGDVYRQRAESLAVFTHNIVRLTDRLSLTAGLRYTHDRKDMDATFGNDNAVCPAQQAALTPLLAATPVAGTLIAFSCSGNSTAALSGRGVADDLSRGEVTGTASLSWKPVDSLLAYATYSRGYKAGGYNLEKADLGGATLPAATLLGNVANLRFAPETVDAYEAGLKFATRRFSLSVAAFRSDFENFQLNTFNGTSLTVTTVGRCSTALNGADRDNSAATGACPGKVGAGVRSQGVELEAAIRPARSLAIDLGLTHADTRYRHDLVGSRGAALSPALFLLPGSRLSNAPAYVATSSLTWTPALGSSGLRGLVYVDQRTTSDYNTGSDLFAEKAQDGFTLVNARIGLTSRDARWAVELWAQNVFNTGYRQIVFTSPYLGGGNQSQVAAFGAPAFGVGNQVFQAYLGDPRTWGLTLRTRF